MKNLLLQLGGETYEIGPLNIGQIEQIQDAVLALDEKGIPRTSASREIIAVALSVRYPAVTAEALKGAPAGTLPALTEAANQVLTFGGFLRARAPGADEVAPKAPEPGEGQPSQPGA